jgi:hypothetical protein
MKIKFKKIPDKTIFISDSIHRYQIVHRYFSWNEDEIPYDSGLFRQFLESRMIVVIEVPEDFKMKTINFNKYLIVDKYVEQVKQEREESFVKIQEEVIEEVKKEEKKKEKEKIKVDKQKEKEKKQKEKIKVLDDDFIEGKM